MAYSLKVSVTSSTGEDVFNLDLTVTGGLSAEEGASLFSSMGNVLGSRLPPGKLEQLDKMVRTSSGQPLERYQLPLVQLQLVTLTLLWRR